MPDTLLETGSLLIVNEDELRLIGTSAAGLLRRGAHAVLVTRGRDGVDVVTADGELSIPGEHVEPVLDSTGAGDAFCGALAALLAEGRDLQEAARIANVAAGLSVRKPGARVGIPTRAELEAYLKPSPSA